MAEALERRQLLDGLLDDANSTFPETMMPEGSDINFTLHFLDPHDYLEAHINWPGDSASFYGFDDTDLQALGRADDNGSVTADATSDFANYGWPYIGHWDLAEVYNVQPTAEISQHVSSNGDEIVVSLSNWTDPSSTDREAGLAISFATTYAGLADTFGTAEFNISASFDPETE